MLPKKFCSPWTKGQVVAFDYGKDGIKNNPNDQFKSDYNSNRFWLIINEPEFCNTVDARLTCIPLNSLDHKLKVYEVKQGKKVTSIKTSGLTEPIVVRQTDRIVFNNFGKLCMLRMTQIKSFPIKEVVDKVRHGWFVPSTVMEVVDEFLEDMFGLAKTDKAKSAIGSIGGANRMNYEVHYSAMDSGYDIVQIQGVNKKDFNASESTESSSKKTTSKVSVVKSVMKKTEPKKKVKEEKKEVIIQKEEPKVEIEVKSENTATTFSLPSSSLKKLHFSSIGEAIEVVVLRFNNNINYLSSLIKIDGFKLEKISGKDINSAMMATNIHLKKKKGRKLLLGDDIVSIIEYIINNQISSSNKEEVLEEIATTSEKGIDETIDEYKSNIKTYLRRHVNRLKNTWAIDEANYFITQYALSKLDPMKQKAFANCFHFDVAKQNAYLRQKYGFRIEKLSKEAKMYLDIDIASMPPFTSTFFKSKYGIKDIGAYIYASK